MESYWLGLVTAFWLGVLTSISPCPLATNIAAISYIGKRLNNARTVLLSGLLYTLGRMITYFALALLIVFSLASIPGISNFLQQHMNRLLGPVLMAVGMILLGLIPVSLPGMKVSKGTQAAVDRSGVWGAGLLGILFTLSLCPVSAALFFGSLLPLAIRHHSHVVMPGLYGFGTALPVLVFAFLIAFSANRLSRAFEMVKRIERWARTITGVLFILIGIYFCLRFIFRIV